MTLDKSLRRKSASARARSVLSRDERLEKLKAVERWREGESPLGLPKVRVYKLTLKKKKKKKEGEEEGAAAATPAAAAGAKPAAGAAAKPAAGGKAGGGKK